MVQPQGTDKANAELSLPLFSTIEKLLISEGTTVDALRSHEFDFTLRVGESAPPSERPGRIAA
jgi:hypothetical protein